MILKKYITPFAFCLVAILAFGASFTSVAQEDARAFTIFLVRHAEKDIVTDASDPSLTPCGQQRAEHLSSFLGEVNIEAVYHTGYARTKATARPTAQSKEIQVEEYSDYNLRQFSKLLLERKQNALVVGHSHTTGVLAGLLAGEEVGHIDLETYDHIYLVVIQDSSAQMHLFHSSFRCEE